MTLPRDSETSTTEVPPIYTARVLFGVAVLAVLIGAVLFVPAGRMDWTLGWVHVFALTAAVFSMWLCLVRWNPVLIGRRMTMTKGTKTWDKVWGILFAPVMTSIYIVAGFEARDGATLLPTWSIYLGLPLFALGMALLTWPMTVNPFFEKTVRIQTDHGHRVIDTGPYRHVRHPGYVGFAIWVLSTPLMLASAWACVPAILSIVGIVIRTALEDRTLHAELHGYPDYAERVRFRLIPGLW